MKNTQSRPVPKRTSRGNRPDTPDRRVRRTKTSLHNALIGLSREKPYPSIAVKEILDRADVGRSTFYMHFRDKDDLLESGIREVLGPIRAHPRRSGSALTPILAVSLPLLKHIDEHRHDAGPGMTRDGRGVMHARLQDVLTSIISDELVMSGVRPSDGQIPADLLARHIAATFVLVLDWWVETDAALTPEDVDARFRALVTAPLTAP